MPQSLGDRIAQARREKGVRDHQDIRPIDVARALNVSGAAVSDWEGDKKTPREELLNALAKYLGVTPAYLRYGIRPEAELQGITPDPTRDRLLTQGEIERARRAVVRKSGKKTDADRKRRGA
jgi:transcriptional regulator with XRE-family HTH domain